MQILAFALTLIVCGIFLIKLLFPKNPEVKRRSHKTDLLQEVFGRKDPIARSSVPKFVGKQVTAYS